MSGLKFMGKNLYNQAQPVNISPDGKIMTRIKPSAHPKSILSPELINSKDMTPTSMGIDGFIYGGYARRLARSIDGFVGALEFGYDFATVQPSGTGGIVYATKTKAGYIVIFANATTNTFDVWFSMDFVTGFTKVLSVTGASISPLNIDVYNKPITGFTDHGIILLGEYSLVTPSSTKKLWMSKDGGQTFTQIFQTTLINNLQNCHWHHSMYDPYSGYIYASQGDGENAKLWVSKDFGATFTEIPCPENNFGKTKLQPTIIIPSIDGLLLAPDEGRMDFPLFLMRLNRTEGFNFGEESYNLEWEKTISLVAKPWDNFARGPYAISNDGSEIYVSFPSAAKNTPDFVLGSGDGGYTWHVVYIGNRVGTNATFNHGIMGIDANGYIYGYFHTGTAQRVWKAKKVDWITAQ